MIFIHALVILPDAGGISTSAAFFYDADTYLFSEQVFPGCSGLSYHDGEDVPLVLAQTDKIIQAPTDGWYKPNRIYEVIQGKWNYIFMYM